MADPVLGPVAQGDLFRTTWYQRLYDQRVLNVQWWSVKDAPVGPPIDRWGFMADFTDFLGVGATSMTHHIQSLQSADVLYDELRCNVYRNLTDRFPYFSQPLTTAGLRGTPARLSNIALSIEKRALGRPSKPRTGIGRMQIAGPTVETYDNGIFNNAYLADAAALCGDLTSTVTIDGVTVWPCLVQIDPVDGFVPHYIFGAAPKRTVRDMRRRTVGVGE